MKTFIAKFSQTFRNEKKEVLAVVNSEVQFESDSLYTASRIADKFVAGLYPNAEIEVLNVSSTKPRKEKEVAPVATTTTESSKVKA